MTKPTKKPEHSPLPLRCVEESDGEELFIEDANEMVVAEILTNLNDGKRFVRRVNSGKKADELADTIINMPTTAHALDMAKQLARQYQAMQEAE